LTGARHLALLGIKHSGKTSAGRILARELGVAFSDTDNLLREIASGRKAGARSPSVREIYQDLGEAGFAALEQEAIQQALSMPPHVIATGGGIADRPQSLQLLGAGALLVYLAVSTETALDRVLARGVPAFISGADPRAELASVFQRRAAVYLGASEVMMQTDGLSSAEIAGRILTELRASGYGW
jgi:shikimate kinase